MNFIFGVKMESVPESLLLFLLGCISSLAKCGLLLQTE